jgi:hypothetical protein
MATFHNSEDGEKSQVWAGSTILPCAQKAESNKYFVNSINESYGKNIGFNKNERVMKWYYKINWPLCREHRVKAAGVKYKSSKDYSNNLGERW